MVLGLLNQLMIVGERWTVGASHAGDSFSLSLWPTRGYGGPPTHNMGFCSRLGEMHTEYHEFCNKSKFKIDLQVPTWNKTNT